MVMTDVMWPGVAANLAPALLRSYEEDNRIQNEQQLHDKYMSTGLGPHHIGDDDQEVPLPLPLAPPPLALPLGPPHSACQVMLTPHTCVPDDCTFGVTQPRARLSQEAGLQLTHVEDMHKSKRQETLQF